MDIFENTIICKNCNSKMQKTQFIRNGFIFRAVECKKCCNKIIHPEDKIEYERYLNLKNKEYLVKLRMVGNSYAISIPKEIINFINEQNRIMDEMIKIHFESIGKISLIFDKLSKEELHERKNE
ncbi:MAG: hypothetical protein QXJ28_01880 [Candidatus Pacearchaeota archaeon]